MIDGVEVRPEQPFSLRRQRLVTVRILPFRYDEAGNRLWSHRSMTVRVDFVGAARTVGGGAAGGDGSWEAVLQAGVLNYDQAKDWRAQPRRAERQDLFALPGRARPAGALAAAAFDEDNPELRVKVDSSGVYQLTYATVGDLKQRKIEVQVARPRAKVRVGPPRNP